MDCTTMFKISDHGNAHAINGKAIRLKFFSDGIQIQQSLLLVLIGAIAAIDDWHSGRFGKFCDGAGRRGTHHNHVAVA